MVACAVHAHSETLTMSDDDGVSTQNDDSHIKTHDTVRSLNAMQGRAS